ncbi:MAG: hydrogenase maturation nickel metallochaperone HypA [Planctomycetes bacterium]|nr:hydrogenase maturation nickel metallochaperone HypA [Planctomycetota bacterium]
MHELSIAVTILDIVAEEAVKLGECRVVGVHLKLGPLSGVAQEALRGAFEIARENSPYPDAKLLVELVPISISCLTCGATRSVVSMQQLCCSVCGTFTSDIVGGRELEVTALEVE